LEHFDFILLKQSSLSTKSSSVHSIFENFNIEYLALQLVNGMERELHFCALIAAGEWRGQGVAGVLLMWSGHVDVCFDLLVRLLWSDAR
jgi:hypothetical protein